MFTSILSKPTADKNGCTKNAYVVITKQKHFDTVKKFAFIIGFYVH